MKLIRLAITLSITVFIISSINGIALAEEEKVPDPAGLFKKKCGICHVTDRATKKKKTAEGWKKTVSCIL